MKFATEDQADQIRREVTAWFDKGRFTREGPPAVSDWFGNARGTALLAVMEYVANQRGLTIYKDRSKDV